MIVGMCKCGEDLNKYGALKRISMIWKNEGRIKKLYILCHLCLLHVLVVHFCINFPILPGFHIHRDSLLQLCGTNVPPTDRIVKILSRVRQLFALKFCQAREFLCLLGLLNSAADQIPHGRLHLWPLQLLLLSRWRPHQDPWIGKFPFQNPYYEKFGNFGTQRFIDQRRFLGALQ
jgi:hypothetical protein